MRQTYKMPNSERSIMLVGSKLTVRRCPSCNGLVSLRTGMPGTTVDCEACHPFRVMDDDIAIEVECAGTHTWHRTLPDGQEAHVSTYPEYRIW